MEPVTLTVRSDDIDTNDHVRGPAYLAYADHARWQALIAAGVNLDEFRAQGLGPVNLETTLRYLHELRADDTVAITSRTEWGTGKTSHIVQQLHRADGVLVAEVSSVSGLLDLSTRHLVPHPDQYWRAHATAPQVLDL